MERVVDSASFVDPEIARLRAELDDARHEIVRLQNRSPVSDDLLKWFGYIAGITILASVVLVLLLVVVRPETDISGLTKMLDTQLSIILGAVLGYAARQPERSQ